MLISFPKNKKEEFVFIPDALKNEALEFRLQEDERDRFCISDLFVVRPPEIVLTIYSATVFEGVSTSIYLFFVCSCGDDTGLTQQVMEKALSAKGWMCHAGFSVTMPNNYVLLPGF